MAFISRVDLLYMIFTW